MNRFLLEEKTSINQHFYKNNLIDIAGMQSEIKELKEFTNNHSIWNNPLLEGFANNKFTIEDYQFIFSQYYYYSKNFTRLLAACMLNCENDYHRSMLSSNLWEEGGALEIEKRHSEIYRQFLKNKLHINFENINFQPYSQLFFDKYLDLCLNQEPIIRTAALSFGTEGIVARLYSTFLHGLKSVGLNDKDLIFFEIHIECDDEHAETLEQMVLSYNSNSEWLSLCKKGISSALGLRNDFFTSIYSDLQANKIRKLISRANSSLETTDMQKQNYFHSNINCENDILYNNTDLEKNIDFSVQRVPFKADILDPRIVNIPAGACNEFHSHAHESIFLILEGEGKIMVEDEAISVKNNDLIFVPRWKKHQAYNTGTTNFKYFAITDYGFTKLFPENSEEVYRLKNKI